MVFGVRQRAKSYFWEVVVGDKFKLDKFLIVGQYRSYYEKQITVSKIKYNVFL